MVPQAKHKHSHEIYEVRESWFALQEHFTVNMMRVTNFKKVLFAG